MYQPQSHEQQLPLPLSQSLPLNQKLKPQLITQTQPKHPQQATLQQTSPQQPLRHSSYVHPHDNFQHLHQSPYPHQTLHQTSQQPSTQTPHYSLSHQAQYQHTNLQQDWISTGYYQQTQKHQQHTSSSYPLQTLTSVSEMESDISRGLHPQLQPQHPLQSKHQPQNPYQQKNPHQQQFQQNPSPQQPFLTLPTKPFLTKAKSSNEIPSRATLYNQSCSRRKREEGVSDGVDIVKCEGGSGGGSGSGGNGDGHDDCGRGGSGEDREIKVEAGVNFGNHQADLTGTQMHLWLSPDRQGPTPPLPSPHSLTNSRREERMDVEHRW
eukprot:TRINITY_DN692_c1_g1_i1.p1 TRINITY_DN692_c1_g1~~TRINITY_DN692_c1_g1_i1.p1  ORF type:complete len:334 (+),score=77.18 TRINITY_DN692_c1_g1_i1:39-1004(+)